MSSFRNSLIPFIVTAFTITRAALAVPALPPLPPAPSPQAVAVPATDTAVAAPAETILYNGQTMADAGLTVASWGGGSGDESSANSISNGYALRVTTLDEYQGAVINFAKPVSLNALDAKKNLVLQVTLRIGVPTLHYTPAGYIAPIGRSGNPGGSGRGRRHGGGSGASGIGQPNPQMPGMMPPGMASPGGPGMPGQPSAATRVPPAALIPPIQNLRLLFTLADGRQADIQHALPDTFDESVGSGWKTVNFPLGGLHFSAAPGQAAPTALKSIIVAGDHYGLFYIGRMKIVDDETPITALLDAPLTVTAGDDFTMHGHAEGGLSELRYSWDFDSSDGITEQATGLDATTNYPTGDKDYTVTLTVTDVDGVKKPALTTATIHVNP